MTSLPTLLIAIVVGPQRSLAATRYISDADNLVISTSVQPCSLIGDPDLYGLGVRVAFYISFGTSFIALLFGLYDELRVPRLSFNVLFASLLIILVRNVHQGSFAVFEWYIVTGLAFVSFLSATVVPLPTDDDGEEEEEEEDEDDDDDEKGKGEEKEAVGEDNGDTAHAAPLDTQMTGARDPGLESAAEGITGNSDERQVYDIEANFFGGEEDREAKFVKMFAFEQYRIILSGPLSLGFSYLLYSVSALIQSWLYFTRMDSGHREGCPVPIVFFGTFDMYNEHWQRFLKALAVLGILSSIVFLPWAAFLIITGAATPNYRAAALRELDKKLDNKIIKQAQIAKGAKEELEQHRKEEKEREQQKRQSISPHNATTQGDPEQELGQGIKRIEKTADEDEAIRRKWRKADRLVEAALESTKPKRFSAWVRQLHVVILVGVLFGALPIYFIERTLQLNGVDLGNDLSNSSGQMLSLLVAVLSSLGFVGQFGNNYLDAKRRQNEFKNVLGALDHGIDGMVYGVDSQIANNRKQLGQMASLNGVVGRLSRPWGRSGRSGRSGATEPLAPAEPAIPRGFTC